MYYVYTLQSKKTKKLYIGRSQELKQRFDDHNAGKVKSTKSSRPWKIIFYEAFFDKKDSIRDEKFFKSGYGREALREKLKYSIINK